MDWSKCRTSKLLVLAGTRRTDEAIVDEAFGECVAFEHATEALWEKHYGPGSAAQLYGMRSRWREELIMNVRQLRTGVPLTSNDPSKTWGMCLGRQIANPAPPDASPDAIADSALRACSPEMQKIRANAAQRDGDADAAAHVEQMRQQARALLIEQIVAQRRSPH